MARKPETNFRLKIEKLIPGTIHREKNSNPFSGGTADSWYSGTLNDLWVEYKFLPQLPQRGIVDSKRIGLSKLQQLWLRGRYEEGRNVAVVIGVPTGGVILRDLTWENGITPVDFAERVTTIKDVANWITQETQK